MFYQFACCLVVVWLISASDEHCLELPPVNNSIFVAQEVEGQILGTYFCIKGYHLVGEKTLLCNATKEWSAPTTKCRLGHCPDPVLVNGEFNYSGPANINDRITFTCNDHYILKGSNWSQCLEDHSWTPPFPICKSRDCGPPGNPPHGYFEGNNFTFGSTITYHCEDGYRLVGTQEQHCTDGDWSSELPLCELIQKAPKPAPLAECEKALRAFWETKDLCKATKDFMQRLKESDLTMKELKYFLEMKKAELKAKILLTL
ncbi:C4b-binding protein beta chain isoform X2 [Otolemur garnettii]|uniref:C4b-binding protein beta chain isoform X2 n=1 Tax=Otolemur garnettii TaxID=30611 RepID=UPI0006445FC5|nr:C4b-binding protein beta chain isoform X2 [Otolemur garnettii]